MTSDSRSRERVLVGVERDVLEEAGEGRLLGLLLVLAGDADELLEVLHAAARLDRPLRLEDLEVAGALEHRLDELVDGQLLRRGLEGLQKRVQLVDGACLSRAEACILGMAERGEERLAVRLRPGPEAADRGVADPAARPIGDAHERHGVVGVVDDLEVRHGVLDLRPLVEARAPDHLVRDALADEHVLEHPALRVRPVEDRDLRARPALLDQPRNLGGDEARLGVLVLDLERPHRSARRRGRRRASSPCARGCWR